MSRGLTGCKPLQAPAREVADTLLIVMRVYFEKPRTSVGWKGFINDPRMDDSFRIAEGMQRARRFLVDVSELGLPAATEALDPIAPQYLGDLIAWTAIGARTSESQTHREMASGLSTPVGFKNGTDGDLSGAINAIISASRPHSFLGINADGVTAVIRTRSTRWPCGLPRVRMTAVTPSALRSEEHTSELQSRPHLVCRLLLEKKKIYAVRGAS